MNPDLTHVRAECERAIEIEKCIAEKLSRRRNHEAWMFACREQSIHSRTHSPRASRALLIAVEAINKLTEFASVNSDAWFVGKKAVAAIAAEFSGEEARELTRGLVASRPRDPLAPVP